ncbi:alpha/beta fold hydrolase [Oceaniglobus roseus]|uniref:alpha/beta fold hydrolase n=1 Tax=Oceaniglobus roseus TaxID=1737570 RepID=UPI000C7E94D2|nr:alpha/beta fold hydrolase [Kandeliimicrobium roseum]
MANFLLIHGSGHGAWCWRDVLPLLEEMGHDARAIDMPGSGDDPTPAAEVTLQGYVDAIAAALDGFDGPVHLLGHSLGGVAITQASEVAADRIAKLIYLCAWVPVNGQTARDMRQAAGCKMLMDATRFSADGLTTFFADHEVEALFYHDCPPETVAFAKERLRPQPIAPSTTPVALTEGGNGVPRVYILCGKDRAIPAAAQRDMTEGWRPGTVHRLETGHSPFFADPEALADLLHDIATEGDADA